MKTITKSLFIVILFTITNSLLSEEVKGKQIPNRGIDTLKTLNTNFARKKQVYLHKPFSTLLHQLPYNVKSYVLNNWQLRNAERLSISIVFDDLSKKPLQEGKFRKLSFLVIQFDESVPKSAAMDLRAKDQGVWGSQQAAFYGKFTIKDISAPSRD